jgi:hypothetical protein
MSYSSVQFIAHCIYTGPNFDSSGKKSYVGLSEQKQDFDARIALLERVLDLAYKNALQSSAVLKIFMLPEFFFRGQKGAYELKSLTDSVDYLLIKLTTLIKSDKWQDWLFIFGTILCEVDASGLLASNQTQKSKAVLNFSFVQRGGIGTNGLERIIPKINKSAMDFIKKEDSLLQGDTFFYEPIVHPSTINENKLRIALQNLLVLNSTGIQTLLKNNSIEQSKWQALETRLKDPKGELFVVREIRKAQVPTKEKPISQMNLDVEEDWKGITRKMLSGFFSTNKKQLNIASNITFLHLTEEQLKEVFKKFLDDPADAFSKQCNLIGVPDQQRQDLKNKLEQIRNITQDMLSIQQSNIPQMPKTISDLNVQDGEGWAFAKKLLEIYIDQYEKDKNSKELLFLDSDHSQFVLEGSQFKGRLLSGLNKGTSKNALKFEKVPYVFSLRDFYSKSDDMPSRGYDFGNITFGLEICYDHGVGLLKRNVGEYFFKGKLPSIDIQLVTSGGMRLGENFVVTKENGYTFFCDGYNPDIGGPNPKAIVEKIKFFDAPEGLKHPCSEARKRGGYLKDKTGKIDLKTFTEIDSSITKISVPSNDLTILSGTKDIKISDLYAQGIEHKQENIMQQGAGKLHIYPPQPLEFPKLDSTFNSIFPDSNLVGAMSNESVLLNGMKVIFDQPVGVYPVTLESKAEERRNGNSH